MGGKAQSTVENREEKGRGTIAMDVIEYREGQVAVNRCGSRPSARGALRSIEQYPRKRTLGARVMRKS